MLDREELSYDGERKAFLEGLSRQMKELGESRLLNLTQNKPLERGLINSVDKARTAKEFLVYLMNLERDFEEKHRLAREQAAAHGGVSPTLAALEDMSRNFYTDLRQRMEHFFRDDRRTSASASV